MRFEEVRGYIRIRPEKNETQEEVARAIARASFDLARPIAGGWEKFNLRHRLSDEEAKTIVWRRPDQSKLLVNLDWHEGRRCKTMLYFAGGSDLLFSNQYYEEARGESRVMLEAARCLLYGVDPDLPRTKEGLFSTTFMFTGRSLDLRLVRFGLVREFEESDWEFRCRIFPELFHHRQEREVAVEFLIGSSAAEWDEDDFKLHDELFEKHSRGIVPGHVDLLEMAAHCRQLEDPLFRHEQRLPARPP